MDSDIESKTYEEAGLLILEANIIVVIGLPASGKTTTTAILEKWLENHSVYHTDDYIDHGYKESLYVMMKDIPADPNPKKIIEGVQCYRFLRKNQELANLPIDLIIICECNDLERSERYFKRTGNAINEAFDKNLKTVWKDYINGLAASSLPAPRMITINRGYPNGAN